MGYFLGQVIYLNRVFVNLVLINKSFSVFRFFVLGALGSNLNLITGNT